MTRIEQIRQQAKKELTTFAENGFIRGATWADAHPLFCPGCDLLKWPPCDKGIPCCKCDEGCSSRQPCQKKGETR